jgi:hypothetical protein
MSSKQQHVRRGRSRVAFSPRPRVGSAVAAVAGLLSVGILSGHKIEQAPLAADPVAILDARLTHGLGNSPLKTALRGPLVRDKTNAALLVAIRDGATEEDILGLFPDTPGISNRIKELENASLLVRSGDRIRPSFPILIGERRERYQELTSRTAAVVYERFRPYVRSLVEDLRKRGWERWAYHFLMAHVFDSQLTWGAMIERKLVPPLRPPIAWVIYPPHRFKTGTNYYYDLDNPGEYVVVANWSPVGAPVAATMEANWSLVRAAAIAGRPADAAGEVQLQALGLLGDNGAVLVPVVRRTDPLHDTLRRMGVRYIAALAEALPLAELSSLLAVESPVGMAITYHDVNWEVLSRTVADRSVTLPAALEPVGLDGNAPLAGICSVVASHASFLGSGQ